MHAGVFWVPTVRGIYGPFFGNFPPLGSFGRAGYRSGLQHNSLVHPRHYQGVQDKSVPQGLLHSYWPRQVSPKRCPRITGLLGYPGVMGLALCFFVKTGNLSGVLYLPTGLGKSWPLLEFLVIFQATAASE